MSEQFSKILATGGYLPEAVLSNQDLEKMVNTSDEWIMSRSGIKNRHIIAVDQTTSDMAYLAAIQAINNSGIKATEIDLIIVATFSPDTVFPSVACLLQQRLGLGAIPAFDINAVCAGFMYALATADAYIKISMARTVLVVGADAVSHYIDYKDRSTCVLFGDGAGAVILQVSNNAGLIKSELHADGNGSKALLVGGGVKCGELFGNPYLMMDGKSVFKMAVKNLSFVANSLLATTGYTKNQIDWLIPHQANVRIIESLATFLQIDLKRVIMTVEEHGNTSAASVPLALNHGIIQNKIKRGDLLLLLGVGAGFTWGGSLIRY